MSDKIEELQAVSREIGKFAILYENATDPYYKTMVQGNIEALEQRAKSLAAEINCQNPVRN